MRAAIAAKVLEYYGCTVDSEREITVTSGGTEALFAAVQAVVHSHAATVVPFAASSVRLRPIYHMSSFLRTGASVFEIRQRFPHALARAFIIGVAQESEQAEFEARAPVAQLIGRVVAGLDLMKRRTS